MFPIAGSPPAGGERVEPAKGAVTPGGFADIPRSANVSPVIQVVTAPTDPVGAPTVVPGITVIVVLWSTLYLPLEVTSSGGSFKLGTPVVTSPFPLRDCFLLLRRRE